MITTTLPPNRLASHIEKFTSEGVDSLKAVTQRTFVVQKKYIPHSLFGRNGDG